jgi:hypothetical protein
VEAGPGLPLLWHTNHGRYVSGAEPSSGGTSVPRGEMLGALGIPAADPDPAWFLRILAGAALPEGVRCDPGPGQPAATLCTLVADLTAGQAIIAARAARPVVISLPDLAEGRPHARRPFEGIP